MSFLNVAGGLAVIKKILGALLRRGFLKAFVSLADFVNLAIPANSENYFLEAL